VDVDSGEVVHVTTHDGSGAPSEAAVRAAAERWARAAGVPVEVAYGSAPAAASAGVRFVRGLMLGAAVGALLLLVVSGSAVSALPWVLLALGFGCLVGASTGRRRRVPARPAASRS
jgi:hypothetical protein